MELLNAVLIVTKCKNAEQLKKYHRKENKGLHILLRSVFQAALLLLKNGMNSWVSLWMHLRKKKTKLQRKNFWIICGARYIEKTQLWLKIKNGGNLRNNNRKWAKNLDYSTDTLLNDETGFVIIAVFIISFIFIAFFINFFIPFKEEKDYIKMEMERSFEEEEYLYWKRELKMLYISKIPIVRSIIRRKYNR